MQLSLLFPFTPAWVVSRGCDRFIVAFEGVAPLGFVEWVQASGVSVVGVAPLPAWRSFGAGVVLCMCVPPALSSVLSAFPSGAGGSLHPANSLPW
ncbi:hypothetical protein [Leptolyngbya sp. FACHB-17]|uniref:hypothetical protein n=1 Tax=unclassified Leptolyngbya TaxID=2650499 RepID=UPI001681BDA1|nr:hypothetical protein [Leptolyngbya sp. FACHB-17]MBD2078430.1 hypothetical protein [Leptolyngbya sp. FACHB-17]